MSSDPRDVIIITRPRALIRGAQNLALRAVAAVGKLYRRCYKWIVG